MFEIKRNAVAVIQKLYDHFDQELCQVALRYLHSYDVGKVQAETHYYLETSDHRRLETFYSKAIGCEKKATCMKFAKDVQDTLDMSSDEFQCIASKLFVAMPLRIDPNAKIVSIFELVDPNLSNKRTFRDVVVNSMYRRIDCSNYLLHEGKMETDNMISEMKKQIAAVAGNNEDVLEEASRILTEHLRKQRTVSIW